jgi:hypothetical protein
MRKHVLGVVLFVLFIVVVAPSALARTPDIGDIRVVSRIVCNLPTAPLLGVS